MKIEVPEVYKRCFSDFDVQHCCKNLWYSPRASWKSSGLGRLIFIYYMMFPKYDVCVGVDTITNAGDGVLSEFQSFIESEGLNEHGEWVFTSSAIWRKGAKNVIRSYAVQTNKLDNVNATKSKKLVRPASLLIMDEVQKLHNLNILLNCLSTFLRQMKAGHSKVVLAGNPDRAAMWFDDYYKDKLQDDEWTVLKPTYKDIIEWLPDALVHEITQLQKTNPIAYQQIYLGDLDVAGWEQTFHSFVQQEHYIGRDDFMLIDNLFGFGAYISALVIGVDDAESRDALAASTMQVKKNGLLRIEESLYLSCKELPVKPALTERCEYVIKYLDYVREHFDSERILPVIMVFDCASGMFRQMQTIMRTDKNYMRWRNVRLEPYTDKGEKSEQLDLVNTAFANGTLRITNVDKYSPQYTNKHLVEQIKALRYKEDGKIDPTIPNDCTDALQYAVMTVLRNPYNLTFPERRARYENDYTTSGILEKLKYGDL